MRRQPRARGVSVRRLACMLLALGATSACTAAPPETPAPYEGVDASAYSSVDPRDNGVWLLRDSALLTSIVEAAAQATTLSVTGTITERVKRGKKGDEKIVDGRTIDLSLTKNGSSWQARISAGKVSVNLIVVGQDAYVSGNAAFAQQAKLPEAAKGFVCLSKQDEAVTAWEPLTDPAALLRGLLLEVPTQASAPAPGKGTPETTLVSLGAPDEPLGQLVVEASGAPVPRSLKLADEHARVQLSIEPDATPTPAPASPEVPCS